MEFTPKNTGIHLKKSPFFILYIEKERLKRVLLYFAFLNLFTARGFSKDNCMYLLSFELFYSFIIIIVFFLMHVSYEHKTSSVNRTTMTD